MSENEEVGVFNKIVWGDIEPPQQVRCVLCGQMIDLETVEGDFDVVLWIYRCDDCEYWTEWEIAGDDDIDSYGLWLVDMNDEDQESQTTRGHEYFWEPNEDGYTAPDFETADPPVNGGNEGGCC